MNRSIVKIDEELCDGCGLCISPCAEGALVLENGKARVLREELCDGAGLCLGVCPAGALSLEVREAPDFVLIEAEEHNEASQPGQETQHCRFCENSDKQAYLLQLQHQGQLWWVCTHCLPRLIHG